MLFYPFKGFVAYHMLYAAGILCGYIVADPEFLQHNSQDPMALKDL